MVSRAAGTLCRGIPGNADLRGVSPADRVRRTLRPLGVCALALAFILGLASGGAAQAETESRELEMVAANAVMSGATAGLLALVRGDPPIPAFLQGAGGGALAYVGKTIATGGGWNGLAGRQVTSVGSSIVGNAVAGRGPLDRVAFSLWPVRLYVGREVDGIDWRIDAVAAGVFLYGVSEGWTVDVNRSLEAGAVVFGGSSEMALPGTIFYNTAADGERTSYVLAHEQVHVLQYDQSFLSLGGPTEEWLAGGSSLLRTVTRRLELNLAGLTAAGVGFFVWRDHELQPWEQEAMYLGRTR